MASSLDIHPPGIALACEADKGTATRILWAVVIAKMDATANDPPEGTDVQVAAPSDPGI